MIAGVKGFTEITENYNSVFFLAECILNFVDKVGHGMCCGKVFAKAELVIIYNTVVV